MRTEKDMLPMTAAEFIKMFQENELMAEHATKIRGRLEGILAGLATKDPLVPMLRGILSTPLSPKSFCFFGGLMLDNAGKILAKRAKEKEAIEKVQYWLTHEFRVVAKNADQRNRYLLSKIICGFRRWCGIKAGFGIKKADRRPDDRFNRLLVVSPGEFLAAITRLGFYGTATQRPEECNQAPP
jgi:hypothetical protein